MLRRMRLRDGARAAPARIFWTARDQHALLTPALRKREPFLARAKNVTPNLGISQSPMKAPITPTTVSPTDPIPCFVMIFDTIQTAMRHGTRQVRPKAGNQLLESQSDSVSQQLF